MQDNYQVLNNDNSIIKLQYNIFCLYHKREFQKAFNLNIKLINRCFEEDDYINLLFAYFNHNQLVLQLKNNVIYNEKFKNDVSETLAYNLNKYNIEEKFYELPVEIRNKLKTLKKFFSMDFINDLYIKIDDEYQKKKEQEKAIRDDNGGLYLDSNVERFYTYQKELVLFYLQNMVLLDKNFRFRQVSKKLCEIEIIRGLTFKEIEFDLFQVYAYIHFINKKNFKELFYKFVNDEMLKSKLIIKIKLQNLLLKLLENNYELFKNNTTPLSFNKNNELSNVIFLFSIIKIDENIKKKIVNLFIKMIEEYNGNLDLYEAIGGFFKIQYILNKTELNKEEINKYYTIIIKKLLKYYNYEEVNTWFYSAFEDGDFDISYTVNEEIFENEELIDDFINRVSGFEFNEQLRLILSLLFGLYKVSKNQTKEKIKNYLLDVYKRAERTDIKLHIYLLFVLNDLVELDIETLTNILEEYLKYLSQNNEFFYFNAIKNNLRTLIEKSKIKDDKLLELNQKLNKINLEEQNIFKGHYFI